MANLNGITHVDKSIFDTFAATCPDCGRPLCLHRNLAHKKVFIACTGFNTHRDDCCEYTASLKLMTCPECSGEVIKWNKQEVKCINCDWIPKHEPVDHKCNECGHPYLLLMPRYRCTRCNKLQTYGAKICKCGGKVIQFRRVECPDCGTLY